MESRFTMLSASSQAANNSNDGQQYAAFHHGKTSAAAGESNSNSAHYAVPVKAAGGPPSSLSIWGNISGFVNVAWQCNNFMRSVIVSPAALSLVTLVIQNTSLVLMTRYSRFSFAPKDTYHTSTMVLNQEILKMFFCLVLLMHERKLYDVTAYLQYLWKDVIYDRETLKLAIPAALFTLQNYLVFISLSHLDAMTFQVLSQTKLLSAAIFSVWLLERHLNRAQWVSLGILTFGVLLANAQGQKESSHGGAGKAVTAAPDQQLQYEHHHVFLLGVAACVTSGLSSSFAGVYFEKVVKTTAPSLAVRNIHLSLFGIPFSILSMFFIDILPSLRAARSEHADNGREFSYFRGYNAFTWCLVAVHAFGGLLVAVVVKYADNILKGFATGVAIIASGVFTAMFWGYVPSVSFVLGCVLVTASSILYHVADKGAHHQLRRAADDDTTDNDEGVGTSTPSVLKGGR